MRIAFIHNDRRIGTGAHYINDLIARKLRERGVAVKSFYPKCALIETPNHLRGLANILFFYSLLEFRREITGFSLIQGTTYTPLPFLMSGKPVVTHFGSTTHGFLRATPLAKDVEAGLRPIWHALRRSNVIRELNLKTRRPLRDIAEIETYAAARSTAVIAASRIVRNDLVSKGIHSEKIEVIHNAIEDYWFERPLAPATDDPHLVFLGRLGGDVFTLKLKGFDRLIDLYRRLPRAPKTTICMTSNKAVKHWLRMHAKRHSLFVNFKKSLIPNVLRRLSGGVFFLPSRYEGFSLSAIECMSQGLVPVSYPVGVMPEIIKNEVNGFLVRTQTAAERCVRRLLTDDRLRRRMSIAAYETSQRFRSDILATKLQDYYRTVLRRHRSQRHSAGH